MQRLEVSGAVRPLYGSLGVKVLIFAFQWLNALSHVSCLYQTGRSLFFSPQPSRDNVPVYDARD